MLEVKRQKVALDILDKSDGLTSKNNKAGLSNLKHLKYIDLGGTSITSLTLSHGLCSPDLRILGLSNCRGKLVSDIGLHEIALKHPRLSSISLKSSCVTDIGLLSCISCLPRLM